MTRLLLSLLPLGLLAASLAACDTGLDGAPFENQAPETALSVRDVSLADNLDEADRLSSTVQVSWSGTDVDGYVAAYEIRFYQEGTTRPPEEGWLRTARTDSLILLPIPSGAAAANVVFEARAIDNEEAVDPEPARTVFPIRNSPPTIEADIAVTLPDTTFPVFSVGFAADDPEGVDNLARVEVSLNDSTRFVALPPEVDFVTFVGTAPVGPNPPATTDARVYIGRGFSASTTTVPGLRLNAENTLYVRAVDQTDTTSAPLRFTWFVKHPRSEVLLVNDWRADSAPVVTGYHHALLRAYLPAGTAVETWDLSLPTIASLLGRTARSNALPTEGDPTLRRTLALFRYIYWVSSNSTNNANGNNLPFAAAVMNDFFDQGGKLMVHTPVSLPTDAEDNLENPAIIRLPLNDLITVPDSIRTIRLPRGAEVRPVNPLPGVAEALPVLEAQDYIIGTLPFIAEGNTNIPLYGTPFEYLTRVGRRRGTWPGPGYVASISSDRRVGLFTLPMVDEQTGEPALLGIDGDPAAPRRAIHLMLESLGFPKQ